MTVRSPLPIPLNHSISNPSFNDLGNQTFRFVIASADSYLLPLSERVGFLWSLALEWWIEVPLALTRPAPAASIFEAGPRETGLCVYVSSRAPMRCPVAQAGVVTLLSVFCKQAPPATHTVDWKSPCGFRALGGWWYNVTVSAFPCFLPRNSSHTTLSLALKERESAPSLERFSIL